MDRPRVFESREPRWSPASGSHQSVEHCTFFLGRLQVHLLNSIPAATSPTPPPSTCSAHLAGHCFAPAGHVASAFGPGRHCFAWWQLCTRASRLQGSGCGVLASLALHSCLRPATYSPCARGHPARGAKRVLCASHLAGFVVDENAPGDHRAACSARRIGCACRHCGDLTFISHSVARGPA